MLYKGFGPANMIGDVAFDRGLEVGNGVEDGAFERFFGRIGEEALARADL